MAPYPLSPPDTPAYYSEVLAAGGGHGAVLNLPMNYDRPGYLLYQTVHQRPLAVAYISRDDSRTLTERIPLLQHFRHLGPDIIDIDPALVGRTVLHDLGVDTVVLDRYKMPGGEERLYTTTLAEAAFADEEPLFEDDRITVFTVTAPAIQQPYPLLGDTNWGALESTEDGVGRQRLIGGPASLHLRHLPDDAQLRLRYRTEPGATLTLSMDANGERLSTLPPAPEGAEVLLERLPPTVVDGSAEATVTLTPSDPDSVWVESITLVVE